MAEGGKELWPRLIGPVPEAPRTDCRPGPAYPREEVGGPFGLGVGPFP